MHLKTSKVELKLEKYFAQHCALARLTLQLRDEYYKERKAFFLDAKKPLWIQLLAQDSLQISEFPYH